MSAHAFYSVRTGSELLFDRSTSQNKDYDPAIQALNQACTQLSVTLCELPRPEIYHHETAYLHLRGFEPNCLHFILKPISKMILLRRAYNILILTAPQTAFQGQTLILDPMAMERRLLKKVAEIWTLSLQSANALRELGFANARHVPLNQFYSVLSARQANSRKMIE